MRDAHDTLQVVVEFVSAVEAGIYEDFAEKTRGVVIIPRHLLPNVVKIPRT
jgi:hypothetical protein